MTSSADDIGDPFTNRGMQLVMIAFVLLILWSIGGMAAIYYGDSFAVPSWNEHSVPPPRMY
jgi:hypothetical protein